MVGSGLTDPPPPAGAPFDAELAWPLTGVEGYDDRRRGVLFIA